MNPRKLGNWLHGHAYAAVLFQNGAHPLSRLTCLGELRGPSPWLQRALGRNCEAGTEVKMTQPIIPVKDQLDLEELRKRRRENSLYFLFMGAGGSLVTLGIAAISLWISISTAANTKSEQDERLRLETRQVQVETDVKREQTLRENNAQSQQILSAYTAFLSGSDNEQKAQSAAIVALGAYWYPPHSDIQYRTAASLLTATLLQESAGNDDPTTSSHQRHLLAAEIIGQAMRQTDPARRMALAELLYGRGDLGRVGIVMSANRVLQDLGAGTHLEGIFATTEAVTRGKSFLKNANFRQAYFRNPDFSDAELTGAHFEGAHFPPGSINLDRAILTDTHWENCTIEDWAQLRARGAKVRGLLPADVKSRLLTKGAVDE